MNAPSVLTLSVPDAAAGQRLDQLLAHGLNFGVMPSLTGSDPCSQSEAAEQCEPVPNVPLTSEQLHSAWPRMGLRAWRRACEAGLVMVNARPAVAALRVRAGQLVTVRLCSSAVSESDLDEGTKPFCLREPEAAELYAALCKPVGWHSEHLSGGTASSVATWLTTAPLPVTPLHTASSFVPHLLNRLDQLTSGLLVVARAPSATTLWTQLEAEGQINKEYLAVVEGALEKPFVACQALNTADRRRTRVVLGNAAFTRRTRVTPLRVLQAGDAPELFSALPPETPLSLVVCHIHQGARHQVRAHLAAAGHPLLGDQLYGSTFVHTPFLHHIRLSMPGWQAECPLPSPQLAALFSFE